MTKPDLTNTAPKRIYLDIGDQFALERVASGSLRWDLLDGVTWSEDNATSHGIPYVRADLVPTPAASGAAPALPPLPEIEPKMAIGYDHIRYVSGYTDSFVKQYATDYALAALASREASAPVLERTIISRAKLAVPISAEKKAQFAASMAALASPQVAPAPKSLDDPHLQQLFGDAIEGALAFGFQGNNPPPESHWLARFWNIGRAEATKTAQPASPAPQFAPVGVTEHLHELNDDWAQHLKVGVTLYVKKEGACPYRRCSDETAHCNGACHGLSPDGTALAAPVAPQDDARDAADTRRMNWLETMAVNVRVPLRCGSRDLFWSSPDDGDGFVRPSDIRSKIDAAMRRSGPAAKPTEPTLPTQGDAK